MRSCMGCRWSPAACSHQGVLNLQSYFPCLQQGVFQAQLESGVGPVCYLHSVSATRNGAHHLVPHTWCDKSLSKGWAHVLTACYNDQYDLKNISVLLIQDLNFMQCWRQLGWAVEPAVAWAEQTASCLSASSMGSLLSNKATSQERRFSSCWDMFAATNSPVSN